MSQKREMPENIRKMFEQRKMASNNSSVAPSTKVTNKVEDTLPKNVDNDNNVQEKSSDIIPNQTNISNQNNDVIENVEKKQKKDKKEKRNNNELTPKNKKTLSKKAKKIITFSILSLVLVVAIVVTVVFCLPKVSKMEPPSLKVHTLSNQIMLYVDENEKAEVYEFYIQKSNSTNIMRIPSNKNVVSLTSLLNDKDNPQSLGKYTVWAKYGSSNNKVASDSSNKVVVTYSKQLDKVEDVDIDDENGILTFAKVTNAVGYKVYYGEGKYIYQEQTKTTGNIQITLNDKLTAGNYSITIQANADSSENSFYTDSELCESINYIYRSTLQPVKTATFTKSTNEMVINIDTAKTNTNKYKIEMKFVGNLNLISFEKEFDQINSTLSFDLSIVFAKYEQSSSNIEFMKVTALGSEYVNDSTFTEVTILE